MPDLNAVEEMISKMRGRTAPRLGRPYFSPKKGEQNTLRFIPVPTELVTVEVEDPFFKFKEWGFWFALPVRKHYLPSPSGRMSIFLCSAAYFRDRECPACTAIAHVTRTEELTDEQARKLARALGTRRQMTSAVVNVDKLESGVMLWSFGETTVYAQLSQRVGDPRFGESPFYSPQNGCSILVESREIGGGREQIQHTAMLLPTERQPLTHMAEYMAAAERLFKDELVFPDPEAVRRAVEAALPLARRGETGGGVQAQMVSAHATAPAYPLPPTIIAAPVDKVAPLVTAPPPPAPLTATSAAPRHCPDCNVEVNAKFCADCGSPTVAVALAPAVAANLTCSGCNTTYTPGTKFCANCGQRLTAVAPVPLIPAAPKAAATARAKKPTATSVVSHDTMFDELLSATEELETDDLPFD